ncbi:uncharacterized protein LOC143181056 [Calliopsis andreniformis]|uniref:uncharacterized protein LOC143181056 n=1 Tax=Calliopsis andreniformis TaxID=337506 RepID=UPI003FCC641B
MLGRLLPNLGGPNEMVRRLYVGVVRAMALYGCSVWAHGPVISRSAWRMVRRVQRLMVIQVVRGYRTLSHETAAVLADVVPFDIQAEASADVYRRLQALRQAGDAPLDMVVESEMSCLMSNVVNRKNPKFRMGHGTLGFFLALNSN